MPIEMETDVPSPIDLRTMSDAREWADAVSNKRPWREDFFRLFVDALRPLAGPHSSVLELGSGPEFLAQRVLSNTALFMNTEEHENALRTAGFGNV